MTNSTLLLLPNLIASHQHHNLFLPESVDRAMATIDGLIAESEKEGRRYLSRFETKKATHLMPLALYNRKTPDRDLDFFLEPLTKGERWGLISDSGMPCIADPGAKLVLRAKALGIKIQAFVGPSSITLALMQSGLNGQRFAFHGYLGKSKDDFVRSLLELQAESQAKDMTQIFMERPYKNQEALETLLSVLDDNTSLCIACELTSRDQTIHTWPVGIWKKSPLPAINNKNVLFLLYKS